MAKPTRTQLCTAISDIVDDATGVFKVQDYNELSESINDDATVQVYWERDEEASENSETERITFAGNTAQAHLFHIDVYARQRAHIGEDMAALIPLVDAIDAKIHAQATVAPMWGYDRVQQFRWSWERVIFEYATVMHVGARCALKIEVY
jgi:hypothetical protein